MRRLSIRIAVPLALSSAVMPLPGACSSIVAPLGTPSLAVALRPYGFGSSSKGEARRLTHEERAARRVPKSREEKARMETLRDEAERFVRQEFEDELEVEFGKIFAKANNTMLRITNVVKCLEALEVPVSGGQKQLLLQLAQIIKHNPTEIHVTPTNSAFAGAILQRIGRFDASLAPQKQGARIVCRVQPMTTTRRDKALQELKANRQDLHAKFKQIRTRATRHLQDFELTEHVLTSMLNELDVKLREVLAAKEEQLAELEMRVRESGVDEADGAVFAAGGAMSSE